LKRFGEFGVIARMNSKFSKNEFVILGSGDDAAVVSMPDGDVVISTDMAVEGVHFRRDWSTPIEIGQRIAAQNLSDIAAMGAYPVALTVAIGVPVETEMSWLEALAVGIEEECKKVGASVVGGDLSRSANVVISVTAVGQRRGLPAITRSGARVGDVVAVAGRLGYSAAGLACLTRGHRSPREAVDAFVIPTPRYELGPIAAAAGVHAMIDVSDGLIADLRHIADASEVEIALDEAALQPTEFLSNLASALGEDADSWVLAGGEDHALVAVFAAETALPAGFRPIGRVEVMSQAEARITLNGRDLSGLKGHDHFA